MSESARVALYLVCGAALGVGIVVTGSHSPQNEPIEWLDPARSIRSFSLESMDGAFDNKSFRQRWTIVSFGFLNCADVCPSNMSQLASLMRQLSRQSAGDDVLCLFISVDPMRDSVAAVDQYARYFDPSCKGVTGSEEQLTRIARDLGIRFSRPSAKGDYAVAHSVTYSIIGPKGSLRGKFRPGFDGSAVAAGLTAKYQTASAAIRSP